MKIFVEQISINQGILTYSNFSKYTDSEDEEGNDFEYDFESIYNNVDDIQLTVRKLYGTLGLIQIFGYYAQGGNNDLIFEAIEFEEASPLKEMIDNLSSDTKIHSTTIPKENLQIQSTDSIFLLNGLLSGLPTNEDLNVMKMLSGSPAIIDEALKDKCIEIGLVYGISEDCTFYEFSVETAKKVVMVGRHNFISLIVEADSIVLDFPRNDVQEKSVSLFYKYVNITKASKLKKSIILDIEYNGLAKNESKESLRDYLVLFNVETAKLESKENKLTK